MDYFFLTNTMLFRGLSENEVKSMMKCLKPREKSYEKGNTILHAGEYIKTIGILLYGSANIEIYDLWGNKTILNHIKTGELFAETYACIPSEPLMVNVVACEKTTVIFLDTLNLITTCENSCSCHNKIIKNLLYISANKNLALSRRSLHTAPKSIRGKLLSYLSEQVKINGSYQFEIPLNRQQLAEYLGVNRSAMSNELSKMQKEGILKYDKNQFNLYLK